ncbi:PTS system mannose/fructose/sorbose family transporter subunit IID [Ligilactobacillus pobuzihii]|uniref:PTS system mannose/fructose/sorbose family transporter subunit IID n=1 Tax=Ligilactobacillus pobuzihii TaxID=449659 RepID=UPI001C65FC30|nr:PTS system mannose/fructose/sorbose family transporter subunit IID [Ligilactobacillus pobuzihii]
MMSSEVIKKKVSKKDLRGMFWRSLTIEASWNFERQQNMAYSYSMNKVLDKLYPEKEKRREALTRHMAFFNCSPPLSTIVMGITTAMEEENANNPDNFDPESVNNVKAALMGPLSGIGDSFFWGTLRILATGLGTSFAMKGNILGPILFLLVYNIPALLVRWFGLIKGYDLGASMLQGAEASGFLEKFSYGASIIGLMVIGGMSASMVSITVAGSFGQGNEAQTWNSMINGILPNMLPLACVMIIYWLLKKKVSTITILIGIFVIGIVMAYFGILKA